MPTLTIPNIDEELKKWTEEFKQPQGAWQVVLYNDNYNSYDNVVLWLQKSTGCSLDKAGDITRVAHSTGRAVCFGGDKQKCQEVAAYLRGKGLQVEVDNAPS